jgi:SAM-dependent methyltransferase
VPRRIGRQARGSVFGRNPEAYDRARLPYPKRVYRILEDRCGLGPGAVVFEIGPGTGIATRELLRRGARPLTLVEPDRRLARYLTKSLGVAEGGLNLVVAPFERAGLPSGTFDLGVAASSFHWTPERLALRKVARLLKPGGWWASWNNLHGDPYRASPLNRALQPLYNQLEGRHSREEIPRVTAAKHRKAGLAALKSVGKFDRISREDIRWDVRLTTSRVTALWDTFSDVLVLPPRKRRWFLRNLGRIVEERFDGEVNLPMLTYVYTARRSRLRS